jgi:hypothetical protein
MGEALKCMFPPLTLSLHLGGKRWFMWRGARYLPGPVDYAYCSLTVFLWCFHLWEARCKEFN